MSFNESAPRTTDTNSVCAQYMWNPVMMADGVRPKETTQTEADQIWTDAANDYHVGLQKINPGIQQGADDELLQELEGWSERPTLTHLEPLPFVE